MKFAALLTGIPNKVFAYRCKVFARVLEYNNVPLLEAMMTKILNFSKEFVYVKPPKNKKE